MSATGIRSWKPSRDTFADAKAETLDGLTIEYPTWWFNLRSSNTEPLIRLNLEADTEAGRDRRLAEVLRVVRDTDPSMEIETG